jgi:hypothetical protein
MKPTVLLDNLLLDILLGATACNEAHTAAGSGVGRATASPVLARTVQADQRLGQPRQRKTTSFLGKTG